jgi:HEPN domain-containing protein
LKAVIVERNLGFRRTHSIRELLGLLAAKDIALSVSEDEMDLMDSIYVPSKYPVYSALPQTLPDAQSAATP